MVLFVLFAFILLLSFVVFYMLCCKCFIFNSYINNQEIQLQQIREAIEENEQREIIREYITMRRTLANYDNHYKKSKVHVEEMEEDKEHVIIVNPCGAEICLGKVITD